MVNGSLSSVAVIEASEKSALSRHGDKEVGTSGDKEDAASSQGPLLQFVSCPALQFCVSFCYHVEAECSQ